MCCCADLPLWLDIEPGVPVAGLELVGPGPGSKPGVCVCGVGLWVPFPVESCASAAVPVTRKPTHKTDPAAYFAKMRFIPTSTGGDPVDRLLGPPSYGKHHTPLMHVSMLLRTPGSFHLCCGFALKLSAIFREHVIVSRRARLLSGG